MSPNQYLLQNHCSSEDSSSAMSVSHVQTLEFLLLMSDDYPNIRSWYLNKVVPGLNNGTRKLVQIYRNEELAAVGIGKKDGIESKICTVRVNEKYRGQGVGTEVFEHLLNWLGTRRPLITVSEANAECFDSIFTRYGFQLTSTRNGLYVPSRVELIYNEASTINRWRF